MLSLERCHSDKENVCPLLSIPPFDQLFSASNPICDLPIPIPTDTYWLCISVPFGRVPFLPYKHSTFSARLY